MDQLKKILDGVKKYSFWLICVAVCAVVLATAIMNAQSMNAARAKLEADINSDIAKVEKVMKTTAETGSDTVNAHPNQTTIDGMKEQIKLAADEAVAAWQMRYAKQAPAYVWPEDLLGPTVAERFRLQAVPEKYLPTGKLVKPADAANAAKATDDSDAEEITTITAPELSKYGEVIYQRMPQLASIIGAKWAYDPDAEEAQQANNADSEGVGSNLLQGRGTNPNAQSGAGVKIEKQVVEWRKADQDRWYNMVTNFKAISRLPSNRPTLPMALYIQQDLWLLESLFKIIKEVNGEADARDNADIKKIDHIYFGRDAQGMSGEIATPNARLLKEAKDQQKERTLPPVAKVAAAAAAPKLTVSANSRDFLHGRYVNGKFEPLPASTVREAIGIDKLSSNAELIVAKRIPFRIAFEMDERKIAKFLAACANSPFRFEVRQVRINRHIPGQTIAADGKTMGGDTGQQDESGAASGGRRMAAGNKDNKEVATRTNYDVKVEFYGIVKIYNPVNRKLLDSADATAGQTASK